MENIKKVLAFAFALGEAVDAARADGQIDYKDLPLLLDPVLKLGAAVDAAKLAAEELKNLTAEERAELDAWAQAEFDISNDELEVKIEKGLALALHVAEFVAVL